MSFISSLKWSFIGEIATKILQPLTFLIVVRFLTPRDYGIVTSTLMVIGFCQIFWDAGLSKTLIQKNEKIHEGTNVHFWVNIISAFIVSLFIFIFSKLIASNIFHDPEIEEVLKIMCIYIVLSSFSAVYLTILQKEMNFKKLFWIKVSSVILPSIPSIPLAINGFGYWSLIYGTIFSQLLQLVLLMNFCNYRPAFNFDKKVALEMLVFSKWVLASALLSWFYVWIDSMIVGMYFGSTEMGLYRTGSMFAGMIFTTIFSPIAPVLYSYLSNKVLNDIELGQIIIKLINVIILIAVPLSFMGFYYSNEIANLVFGDKWPGVGFVIGVMLIMHGFSWIVGMNGEIYRSKGKPSYETIVNFVALAFYLFGYLYSIKRGLIPFVWVRLVLSLFALLLHFLVLSKVVKIKYFNFFLMIFIISILTWGTLIVVNHIMQFRGIYKLIINGGTSFILTYLLIFIFDKNKTIGSLKEILLNRNDKNFT